MKPFSWIVSAAIAAYACHLAVHHATPVDRALPLLGAAVTLCAAVSYRAVMLGVPLLVVISAGVFDERLRLLLYGAVVAAAVSCCLLPTLAPGPGDRNAVPRPRGSGNLYVAATAIVLLRWVPLADVLLVRELLLLGVCLAIVHILGRTPFAVMVAVVTALATPAIPLRTLAVPMLVLGVAVAARAFGMPRLELRWPSTVVVAFTLLFFAWSGVVARAFPYFLREAKPDLPRHHVGIALAPNRSLTLDVPERARWLIVSGANVAHFRRGALLGRIEPGAIDVRIGDAADWGALRREHAYGSRNPLPRDPAGQVRGYGYWAWLDGAGRLPLPRGARTIRITGAASLPANASLQVEGFE